MSHSNKSLTKRKAAEKSTAANSGRTASGQFAKGNEHRFQPGQSGNPSGRPKTKLLSEGYAKELERVDEKTGKTMADLITERIVKKARKGDLPAAKEVADRTQGRPLQQVAVSGPTDLAADLAEARARANKE